MANVGSGTSGYTYIGAGNGASGTYKPIGTNSGLTNHGIVIAQGNNAFAASNALSNGQLLIGSSAANPVPATLTAGQGISITNGSGSITISATDVSWSTVSTNQSMVSNNGYIAISPGGALTFALPAASAVGDILEIILYGATSFQITQAAGQQIRIGNQQTTAGATGSLTSTA